MPRSDDLRAFVAVARRGGVARAAAALGRTQPAISARIAALEAAWGTRLFRREPRGMALTPEGARLLPGAEAALAALDGLDRAAGVPVAPPDEVRVGAGDALGRELLPRVLGQLRPEVVRVVEGPAPRLLEALRRGEIDVALVVAPEDRERDADLRFEPFLTAAIDVLFPPGRAPRGARVTPERLARSRLVSLQAGSSFRRRLERLFQERGLPFRPDVEVGNLSLVRRFVAAGLGAAPVPAVAFGPGSPGPAVERRRLAGAPPIRYAAASRAGVPLPAAALRLLDGLRAECSGGEGGKATGGPDPRITG